MANRTFGEVHNKDALIVHNFSEIKGSRALAENVAGEGRGKKLADFVEDRGDGFASVTVRPGAEVLYPIGAYFGVSHVVDDMFTVLFTNEHTAHTKKGGVGGVEEGGNSVVYKLLHASLTPCVLPDVLKGGYEGVSDKRPVVGRNVCEGIKSNRVGSVRDIKVEHVLHARWGNVIEERLCVGAVGVNEGKAVALGNVADDEIFEHGGLARTGLANHIEVVGAIVVSDTEGVEGVGATIAALIAERCNVVIKLCGVVTHGKTPLYYGGLEED